MGSEFHRSNYSKVFTYGNTFVVILVLCLVTILIKTLGTVKKVPQEVNDILFLCILSIS